VHCAFTVAAETNPSACPIPVPLQYDIIHTLPTLSPVANHRHAILPSQPPNSLTATLTGHLLHAPFDASYHHPCPILKDSQCRDAMDPCMVRFKRHSYSSRRSRNNIKANPVVPTTNDQTTDYLTDPRGSTQGSNVFSPFLPLDLAATFSSRDLVEDHVGFSTCLLLMLIPYLTVVFDATSSRKVEAFPAVPPIRLLDL
jgi:hypothetical protein